MVKSPTIGLILGNSRRFLNPRPANCGDSRFFTGIQHGVALGNLLLFAYTQLLQQLQCA